jgi:hypothetical protein
MIQPRSCEDRDRCDDADDREADAESALAYHHQNRAKTSLRQEARGMPTCFERIQSDFGTIDGLTGAASREKRAPVGKFPRDDTCLADRAEELAVSQPGTIGLGALPALQNRPSRGASW